MSTDKDSFRFSHRMRVRWAEVDMQKIVFNAHYLMYLDTAVADYWRALALPYEEAMLQLGGDLYVKKATLEYHASARYEDWIDVALKCVRVGNSSMVFEGGIFCGDTLLVSGELIYVFADPASQTSRPVPPVLQDMFTDFEAGKTMVTLKQGDWHALGETLKGLRDSVFVREQGIDPALVVDDHDHMAVHIQIANRLGQAVAGGRLTQQAAGIGRIGRMAVHRALRGSRLGHKVLLALVKASRDRGDHEVMLHAQHSAIGFYQASGFVSRGSPFEEAAIAHQEMVLDLTRF